MFCVYVCCPIKPEKKEAFREIAIRLMELTRKEEGCLSYEIGETQGDCVAWVERWASEEALRLHKAAPYYDESEAAMEGFFSGPVQAWRVEPFA